MQKQIIPLTPTADHTGLEGRAVKNSAGSAALVSSAADIPIGVITEGAPVGAKDSVALPGIGELVDLKLDAAPGTVNPFTYLVITATGTFKADSGAGARVRFAQAIEAGAADEIIRGRLVEPQSLT